MSLVQPASPRSFVTEASDGVLITIPCRRNWAAVVFLMVWLTGWSVGEIFGLTMLLTNVLGTALTKRVVPGPGPWFMGLWLLGWTVGGLWAMYSVGLMLTGKELIFLNRVQSCLALQQRVWGFGGRTREYALGEIRRLRVSTEGFGAYGFNAQRTWMMGTRTIAFDYGANTYRFGAGVDEAEAQAIVDTLREQRPSLVV